MPLTLLIDDQRGPSLNPDGGFVEIGAGAYSACDHSKSACSERLRRGHVTLTASLQISRKGVDFSSCLTAAGPTRNALVDADLPERMRVIRSGGNLAAPAKPDRAQAGFRTIQTKDAWHCCVDIVYWSFQWRTRMRRKMTIGLLSAATTMALSIAADPPARAQGVQSKAHHADHAAHRRAPRCEDDPQCVESLSRAAAYGNMNSPHRSRR